ncbi:MAG: Gfo/Idh/MocA family protein, partial [Stellaceae bacterium]
MKIAVIGCGKQGRRHLAAFKDLPGVTGLVAADADPARARSLALDTGAAATSVEAALTDGGVGAAVIATPTLTHLALTRRAIDSGKHVLCEKPFGADATAARRLAAGAAAAALIGRVGYLYRFAPAIAEA